MFQANTWIPPKRSMNNFVHSRPSHELQVIDMKSLDALFGIITTVTIRVDCQRMVHAPKLFLKSLSFQNDGFRKA